MNGETGVAVGAMLEVIQDGKTYTVEPFFVSTEQGGRSDPVEMPGGGQVELTQLDASSGTIMLEFQGLPGMGTNAGSPSEYLALEVSIKPLINLFWVGTILVMIGLALSMWQRFKETSRA
jgi:hypothetical protein